MRIIWGRLAARLPLYRVYLHPGCKPMRKLFTLAIIALFIPLCLPSGLLSSVSFAQVATNITSSGLGTKVDSHNSSVTNIIGGTRPDNGPNLFHSFGEFSIAAGEIANFLNESGLPTENILSRVTGDHASQIMGTIQSTDFGNANIFLMNPNGVVFGPTASLDVNGSFHVTTAEYIRLADNVRFTSSSSSSDALLSVAPVEAFGFLNANPASITYDGSSRLREEYNVPMFDAVSLDVDGGQTLSLVGGDIQIMGNFDPTLFNFDNTVVNAPGGQVNIVSVMSSGEAVMSQSESFTNFSVDSFSQLGDVSIIDGASINSAGNPGETVIIQGGRLMIQAAGISTTSGDIVLKAEESIDISDFAFLSTQAEKERTAGNIDIVVGNGGQVAIKNFSALATGNDLGGVGPGTIAIIAEGGDLLLDQGAITSSFNPPMEESGTVSQTQLQEAANNATPETVTPGQLQIRAENLEIVGIGGTIQVNSLSSQEAGGISIDLTGDLHMRDGAEILAISRSQSDAGDLNISAKSILVTGGSGIFTDAQSDGRGGNLNITAETLLLTEQGSINSRARTPIGSINRGLPAATGDAGNITINLSGDFVATNGGKVLADTENTGAGGSINVNTQNLFLREDALISAESTSIEPGAGNAGNISLTAANSIQVTDSSMTTKAENALGGNIKLTANDRIQITNSDVTSQVLEGSDSAGKIDIDPDFVVIQNSNILSTAVSGDGGPITIIANSAVLVDPFSTLDASSQFGGNGSIDIQAPIQQLSEAIAPLPEDIVKAAALYAEACASQKGGQFSTMVKSADSVTARAPGGFLLSPLAFSNLTLLTPTSQAHLSQGSDTPSRSPLHASLEDMTWTIHEHHLPTTPFHSCTPAKG